MNRDPKRLLETVDDILKKYWDGCLPIDPLYIVAQEGIRLEHIRDKRLSGSYRVNSSSKTIEYNPEEHPRRQRFTIAHELGHHFLNHGSEMIDPPENLAGISEDPKEIDANNFAACLLMPEYVVKRLIRTGEVRNITELADKLNVSEIAMHYRLRNLGICHG